MSRRQQFSFSDCRIQGRFNGQNFSIVTPTNLSIVNQIYEVNLTV
jgi:hypothetical protein